MFKQNKSRKLVIVLAVAILAIMCSMYMVQSASCWVAPSVGYITQVSWSITSTGYDQPVSGTITLDGNTIDYWYNSGGTNTQDGVTSVSVWTTSGAAHTVWYTFTGGGEVNSFSGDVTGFTPYYLVQASSAYGSPTISVNGGGAQSLPVYVQSGASYTVSVSSPVSLGSGIQAVCSNPSQSFTASSDNTVSFNWQVQYQVTYSVSGLDSSAQGTVVNGVSYSSLPYSTWVNSGSSTSFTYSSTVSSSTTGKQFRLSYSTYASPLTVNAPYTIQGVYVTQYLLSVSTPYSSATGASGYYDAGSQVQISIYSNPVSGGSGTQYVLSSWSGSGSGSFSGSNIAPSFYVNGPITETALWNTQYYLTVVGVYSYTTGDGWYNSGATASFSVTTSPVGTQTFSSWSGSGSGSYSGPGQSASCTMNAPVTETSNWIDNGGGGGGGGGGGTTQYQLTVVSSYGTTLGTGAYDAGTTVYAGLVSGNVSGGSGVRYIFQSWSTGGTNYAQSDPIVLNSPVTVTASWITQYSLTVSSAYGLPTSGGGWYNSGVTAYASVSSNTDGSHTFQGWSGDASGSHYYQSNAITMSSPKTATASWTGSVTPIGPVSYNVTINGPFYEYSTTGNINGDPAAGNSVIFTLSFANNTVYQGHLNSSIGVAGSIFVSSTSPFTQLTWNASSTSSTLNSTRIYRFANGANGINDTSVNLYILDASKPAYQYTFSVSDYYGMINPFLETNVSPDGVHSFAIERVNLNETGGYVTFVMQQYQIYTLVFVCQQGTYSQTFTAQTLGTPGQVPVSLNILAGNFNTITNSTVITSVANRTGNSNIIAAYFDPSGNTAWVSIVISHKQGTETVVDYSANTTGNSQAFSWSLADKDTTYYVTVSALSGATSYGNTIVVPSVSIDNPWASIDWNTIGQYIPTLPVSYSGWNGLDPAQLIAGIIILFALGIGSFYSTVASMFISWGMAGLMTMLGWWQCSVFSLVFALLITIFVAFDEYKKGTFNL